MNSKIENPEIRLALRELRSQLRTIIPFISKITIFGSSIQGGVEKFHDIDVLIHHTGASFDDMKSKISQLLVSRSAIIENAEMSYSNHPKWDIQGPPTFHILLYSDEARLTKKVVHGLGSSLDITAAVIGNADEDR